MDLIHVNFDKIFNFIVICFLVYLNTFCDVDDRLVYDLEDRDQPNKFFES